MLSCLASTLHWVQALPKHFVLHCTWTEPQNLHYICQYMYLNNRGFDADDVKILEGALSIVYQRTH